MSPSLKYKLEFILCAYNTSLPAVKNSLAEFGTCLSVLDTPDTGQKGKNYLVNIVTEEPALIFDVCSQLGRIRSVKIDEEGK